jgi:hypothetical protein
LNKIRCASLALGAVIVFAGLTSYYEEDFSTAQAATDRETVACLTQQMTPDEKVRIARLTAAHDSESQRPIFTDILSRCVLRADQWDRRSQLVSSARQSLSYDAEFRQLVSASTMEVARRP